MYFFLPTCLEARNLSHLPGLQDVLQENEGFHPELLYLPFLIHNDMLLMAAKDNHQNNVYEHLFLQADATSAGHLLQRINGLQKEEDVHV